MGAGLATGVLRFLACFRGKWAIRHSCCRSLARGRGYFRATISPSRIWRHPRNVIRDKLMEFFERKGKQDRETPGYH